MWEGVTICSNSLFSSFFTAYQPTVSSNTEIYVYKQTDLISPWDILKYAIKLPLRYEIFAGGILCQVLDHFFHFLFNQILIGFLIHFYNISYFYFNFPFEIFYLSTANIFYVTMEVTL